MKLNIGFIVLSIYLLLTVCPSGNVNLQYGSAVTPSSGRNPNATGIFIHNLPFIGFLFSYYCSLNIKSRSSVNGSGGSLFCIPYKQYIIYKYTLPNIFVLNFYYILTSPYRSTTSLNFHIYGLLNTSNKSIVQ